MMFLSNVCYHTYSVVVTYQRGSEVWREYWQLARPCWTAHETKMIWNVLHDAIKSDACNRVTARVYECELEQLPAYSSCCFVMRFSSSVWYSLYSDFPVFDRANGDIVRKWYLER